MSQGAYLEFANRAFDKVDVTVDFCNKKDWEHGKYPQWEWRVEKFMDISE